MPWRPRLLIYRSEKVRVPPLRPQRGLQIYRFAIQWFIIK